MEQEINYDKGILYTSMHDFFRLKGNINMRLTKEVAIELCKHAMDYDILIWGIEGGLWHNPGFQPCGDAICDGVNPPVSREEAIKNNLWTVKFLTELMPPECDVCLLTVTNYQGLPKEHLYDKYFEKHPNN